MTARKKTPKPRIVRPAALTRGQDDGATGLLRSAISSGEIIAAGVVAIVRKTLVTALSGTRDVAAEIGTVTESAVRGTIKAAYGIGGDLGAVSRQAVKGAVAGAGDLGGEIAGARGSRGALAGGGRSRALRWRLGGRRRRQALVTERQDLPLDAPLQRAQQEAERDTYLDVVGPHGHVAGRHLCAGSARVSFPRVGAPEVAAQALGHRLLERPGLRRGQAVPPRDDDLAHPARSLLAASSAATL